MLWCGSKFPKDGWRLVHWDRRDHRGREWSEFSWQPQKAPKRCGQRLQDHGGGGTGAFSEKETVNR